MALLIQGAAAEAWRPSIPATPDHACRARLPLVGAFVVARRPGSSWCWLMCAGGLFAGLSCSSGC
ncbi:hypothetical protein [Nonomuraea dietziae]|uniref:hypothetical protein n=1 Tax=Nonomuraea dietziae TaxID=65515 RepID=UPI0031CDEDF1